MNDKKQITELITKMFGHLDNLDFNGLKENVFADQLFFDVDYPEQEPKTLSSTEVCSILSKYINNPDVNDRKLGEIIINFKGTTANVFTSAVVTHFKKNTKEGNVREVNGNYHLILEKVDNAFWQITSFNFKLNQVFGNLSLN